MEDMTAIKIPEGNDNNFAKSHKNRNPEM